MKKYFLASLLALGVAPVAFAKPVPFNAEKALERSYQALDQHADDYGIIDAKSEFRMRSNASDQFGQSHVRMDQYHRGVPVFGEQLITHLDTRGNLLFLNGSYALLDPNLSVRPTILPDDAFELALLDFAQEPSERPQISLKVLPTEDGEAVLVYHVVLEDIQSDSPSARTYFINAHNGTIEWDFNSLKTAFATGTGNSLYSGTVSIGTNSTANGYELVDPSRGSMYTTNMKNSTSGNGTTFTDADNEWGNSTSSDSATAGVDAHFGAEMTWDYYLNNFERKGIWDSGKGSFSRVHYGNKYVNAFWSDSCGCMTYGDGDNNYASPLVSLDVAGHEMTHGVTSATSDLTYSGESGAMNESISDMFGTIVEYHAINEGGATTKFDYWIGEDIWTPSKPGDALRYMDTPTKDGKSIDNAKRYYSGMDVHYSSGVANNVFFLMSEGGKNSTSGQTVQTGIGVEKAAAIWYRANAFYLGPNSKWKDGKSLTIKAAGDLYGTSSQEVTTTTQAWKACGVR